MRNNNYRTGKNISKGRGFLLLKKQTKQNKIKKSMIQSRKKI